jgi:hypothetical protein
MYEDDGVHLYGLYDIITSRFVYIHSNPFFLKLLAVLFSSRYRLFVCQIDCAANYYKNIIDNTVMTNWGIKFDKFEAANMLSRFDFLSQIYKVPELIELGTLPDSEIIVKDIEYFKFVEKLVQELFLFLNDYVDGYSNDVDGLYKDVIGVPFHHKKLEFLTNSVFKVIYLELNLETAKKEILDAFDEYNTRSNNS